MQAQEKVKRYHPSILYSDCQVKFRNNYLSIFDDPFFKFQEKDIKILLDQNLNTNFSFVEGINIFFDEVSFQVYFDIKAIHILFGLNIPEEFFVGIPDQIRCGVFSSALNSILASAFPEYTGQFQISLIKNNLKINEDNQSYKFNMLVNDGETGSIVLSFDNDSIDFLSRHLLIKRKKNFDFQKQNNLFLNSRVVIGRAIVNTDKLENISVGDVILLDRSSQENTVVIETAFKHPMTGNIEDDAVIISNIGESSMSNLNEVIYKSGDELEEELDIDSLEVELKCDIGNVVIPVTDLADLKPGYVLKISENYEKEVNIRSRNALVATGVLVSVGDCLGVQITENKYGNAR